jgi:hypothetical protein
MATSHCEPSGVVAPVDSAEVQPAAAKNAGEKPASSDVQFESSQCVHGAGVPGQDGADGVGGTVPDPHRPIATPTRQPGAVRTEDHCIHRFGVSDQSCARCGGGPVPDLPRTLLLTVAHWLKRVG